MISIARQIYYYIRLGRPLFLLGGILLHGLGALAALSAGESLDLAVLIWGQIAITAIQIMTHYSNDYFDMAADAANSSPTRWSGGSRILPDGLINPQIALATAIASGLVGLFAAFWLAFVLKTGPLTLPISNSDRPAG